jgi:hypothetical protein
MVPTRSAGLMRVIVMQNDSNNPQLSIVTRLHQSFADLEKAIHGARETLSHKEHVPAHVFERLDSYDQIITRQRNLAKDLERHIQIGDMVEISRHVMIINSLSGMIIDDAKQILQSLSHTAGSDIETDYQGKIC